jgi:hypothetical protein
LNLRSFAREHIKFEVGLGHSIHLWHDNWHPLGPLHAKFGLRIIYDSQSTPEARVSFVIKNGEWFWKPARSEDLVVIQCRLPEVGLVTQTCLNGLFLVRVCL